ncbi:MAG: hypothetical protein AABX04_01030 [Nanoarchaeota archaeon]
MAKCEHCNQEMDEAESCDKGKFSQVEIKGKLYLREVDHFMIPEMEKCGDCGIIQQKGNLHHFGCDLERCPKCKGQLLSCRCKAKLQK